MAIATVSLQTKDHSVDVKNWFLVVATIGLALYELGPAWKNRRKRDKEWWTGLLAGLVALTVAIVVSKAIWDESVDNAGLISDDARERIVAQMEAEGLSGRGAMPPGRLSFNARYAKSLRLVSGLQGVMLALEWTNPIPNVIDAGGPNQPKHTGTIIYATEKTKALNRLVELLRAEGVDIRLEDAAKSQTPVDGVLISIGRIE